MSALLRRVFLRRACSSTVPPTTATTIKMTDNNDSINGSSDAHYEDIVVDSGPLTATTAIEEEKKQGKKRKKIIEQTEKNTDEIICPKLKCALSVLHTECIHITDIPATSIAESKGEKNNHVIRSNVFTTSSIRSATISWNVFNFYQNENDRKKHFVELAKKAQMMNIIIQVKPLIVLDLNGLLCRRIRARLNPINKTFRNPVGENISNTPVVPRSDLDDFLLFLDSKFTLAVWTSAQMRTARKLVNLLFPSDIQQRLLFVWGQNKCDLIKKDQQDKLSSGDQGLDVIYAKALNKVWSAFPLWNAHNTLLMDDSPEKCPERYQNNYIHPPPILGYDSKLNDDERIQMAKVLEQENNKAFFTLRNLPDDEAERIRFNEIMKIAHERRREFMMKVSSISSSSPSPSSSVEDSINNSHNDSFDDDWWNQTKQYIFFEKLAKFWDRTLQDGDKTFLSKHKMMKVRRNEEKQLYSFLQESAVSFMGWRGEATNPDANENESDVRTKPRKRKKDYIKEKEEMKR